MANRTLLIRATQNWDHLRKLGRNTFSADKGGRFYLQIVFGSRSIILYTNQNIITKNI